jgi:hypothetical protein
MNQVVYAEVALLSRPLRAPVLPLRRMFLFCIMFLLQFFDALYCSSHYACKFDDIEYARCIALCSSSSTLVQFDQQSNVSVHAQAEASATERAHARANRLAAAL